jgi:putative ABC transport system permease protein
MNALRQTLRRLRNAPGFTLTTLLTLAIGIGATTAIFSVVNGILLKPLPFAEPDRLIQVGHRSKDIAVFDLSASPALYLTYRDNNRTFESIALWWNSTSTVTGAGDPEEPTSLHVTNEFLPTLRVAPLLGRSFAPADDELGAPPTVMLSYGYWQRRFGGTADVLGTSVTIGGAPHTVIGVLPQSFRFVQQPAEILVPAGQFVRQSAVYGPMGERAIARLKPGVTLADVAADMERMLPIAIEKYPYRGAAAAGPAAAPYEPFPRPLKQYFVGDLGNVLWVLMGTIGMLLAIACANVANLQLARTESRGSELAIRAALGASRGSLARNVLAESTLLGVAGGALGVALAVVALPGFLALAGNQLPTVLAIGIDPLVLAFAAAVSIASGLLFGCVPAFKYGVARAAGALGGRAHSASRERHRARSSLVVVQVALALVLLVAAGLMIRTFDALRRVEPGFADGDRIQTFLLTMPGTMPIDRVQQTQRAIQERVLRLPGVESVGFQSVLPLSGGPSAVVRLEDRPVPEGSPLTQTEFRFTSPAFVETLRTPLVAGRTMTWADLDGDRQVALVSESLARSQYGSPEAALGKRLRILPGAPWQEVIGVLGNVHYDGLDGAAQDTAYLSLEDPMGQWVTRRMSFAVRSERVGTTGFTQELQQAVWSVDPSLPLAALETMDDIYARSLTRTSLTLTLLGIAGAMALALGLVGVYGVLSYMLAQRTREIGIRIALGAQNAAIKRLLLGQVLGLVGIGVALGLGGAAALTRFMESLLFGVKALDLETYALGAVALLAAAALAAYLPARRATRIDPMQALRAE